MVRGGGVEHAAAALGSGILCVGRRVCCKGWAAWAMIGTLSRRGPVALHVPYERLNGLHQSWQQLPLEGMWWACHVTT
jgi:hypothetical protein